ncbi:MAG TPA: SpoIID/LytB domain-containing protein [Actinomycetota bacterium]|nr:SpoIID/LytB domain-containing protein [Actinomycetota bacterium]
MRRFAALIALALVAALVPAAPALAERTVTLTGGGWGHGIGMSQYGTLGRAQRGDGHEEILEHYYTGAKVATVGLPGHIRVGLLWGQPAIAVTAEAHRDGGGKAVFKVEGSKAVIAEGGNGTTFKVEASSTGGMRLYRNGERVKHEGRTVFGSPSKKLVLLYEKHGTRIDPAAKPYDYAYGRLDFGTYKTGDCSEGYCTRMVAQLSMQKYLYGLGEVPASWPHAALRTQVVAARTYAWAKLKATPGQDRYPCDCAVYDSTADQVYSGDGKRLGSGQWWDDWQGAVNATKDEVVLFGGEPITAYYSSSSGGHTENIEKVWGGATPVPYLRGVPDKPDAVDSNPNHSWDPVKMTWGEFGRKLDNLYGVGLPLEDFAVVGPRGVSGRVTPVNETTNRGGVRIRGADKTVRVDGWEFRTDFGLRDTLFYVKIETEVGDNMKRKYRTLDGAPGEPRTEPYAVPRGWKKPRGWAQDFEVGRMWWNRSIRRALWQWGAVLTAYDELGREKSGLGMPTSDVWGPGRFRGASYEKGDILWSKKTGGRAVRGAFRTAYRRNDGAKGPLGLPVGRQTKAKSLPGGGRRQRFQHGSLYLNPKADLVLGLWGRRAERYRKIGEASSDCGYPTEPLTATANAATATFEHGVITWTEASGVKVACG